MKYKLLIVESPTKQKKFEKFLGKEYKVMASKGHILDLPPNTLGVDIQNNFKTKIIPMKGKEDIIKSIQQAAKNATEIYLAPDPDREGESIAFHLKKIIKEKVPMKRVYFNEITEKAVKKGIENATVLNTNMYHSQQARRILDRLMGYQISPLLWYKIAKGLSAGRVQSVVLRLVVEREDEIRNFVPTKTYQVNAFLDNKNEELIINYFGEDIKKKITLKDHHQAEKIIKNIKNQKFKLDNIEKKDKFAKTKPPFITSSLQQEASSKLSLSLKKTMEIAQKLYEGKNIPSFGSVGLITYMRTDSVRINEDKINEARNYIKESFGENYLPKEFIEHGKTKKGEKIQDAHEAIRPTDIRLTPNVVKDSLTMEEYKLYTLIWNRFIASQMKEVETQETIYWFKCKEHFFKVSGNVLIFDGWKRAYSYGETKSNELNLPKLDEQDELNQIKDAEYKENLSSPPKRYSESDLSKEMEKKGIGRPSTYATIIEHLLSKKYMNEVPKQKRVFRPTELGEVLCRMLIKNFPKQMDVKFTAHVEKQLDLIESGEEKWLDVLSQFWEELENKIKDAYKQMIILKPKEVPLEVKCSECENGMLSLFWKKERCYVHCDRCTFEELSVSKSLGSFEKVEIDKEKFKVCSKCNSIMDLKKGKYGEFWGCSNYPDCNNIEPVTLDVNCPKCQKGNLYERSYKDKKTNKQKKMYPCSNTQCKFVMWNKPVVKRCLNCSFPLMGEYTTKDKRNVFRCPSCQKFQNN